MIILVHGINDSYRSTVGRLSAPLARHEINCIPFRWGPVGFWRVRREYKTAGEALSRKIWRLRSTRPGEPIHVVCHSAGGLVLRHALNSCQVDNVYFIAPAMRRDPKLGEVYANFSRAVCLHNCFDWAVLAGALLLRFHPFGLAGSFGFWRGGAKIVNVPMPSFTGRFNHSENWFEGSGLKRLVDEIVKFETVPGCPVGPRSWIQDA